LIAQARPDQVSASNGCETKVPKSATGTACYAGPPTAAPRTHNQIAADLGAHRRRGRGHWIGQTSDLPDDRRWPVALHKDRRHSPDLLGFGAGGAARRGARPAAARARQIAPLCRSVGSDLMDGLTPRRTCAEEREPVRSPQRGKVSGQGWPGHIRLRRSRQAGTQ